MGLTHEILTGDSLAVLRTLPAGSVHTNTTHIDVGYSRQYAAAAGIQPTTLILCGAKDGDSIRDGREAICSQGGYPAACNCAACQGIARIMYDYDCTPEHAQAEWRKRGSRIA